jgi:hypothetical protein
MPDLRFKISDKTLQGVDSHWLVEILSIADIFTRMIANPTANGRKRIFFEIQPVSLHKELLGHQGDKSAHVHPCGTGFAARRGLFFKNRPKNSPESGFDHIVVDTDGRRAYREFFVMIKLSWVRAVGLLSLHNAEAPLRV